MVIFFRYCFFFFFVNPLPGSFPADALVYHVVLAIEVFNSRSCSKYTRAFYILFKLLFLPVCVL